jgi:cytidine deaminase
MNDWNFMEIRCSESGSVYHELTGDQRGRVPMYVDALKAAATSRATYPIISNFHVRGAVLFPGMETIRVGNVEYGWGKALHMEEMVVAAARCLGVDTVTSPTVLAIISSEPSTIIAPCGNCRDILLETFGTNLEIVCGSPDGGIATVIPFRQVLHGSFDRVNWNDDVPEEVRTVLPVALDNAKSLVNDAYSPESYAPERRYGAFLQAENEFYAGAHDVMCDFHPIYALRDAIRQAIRAHDTNVRFVLITCELPASRPPHVLYKDRQHLLELLIQSEHADTDIIDPPVYLVSHDHEGTVLSCWETRPSRWLPMPFSTRDFGSEFMRHFRLYHLHA